MKEDVSDIRRGLSSERVFSWNSKVFQPSVFSFFNREIATFFKRGEFDRREYEETFDVRNGFVVFNAEWQTSRLCSNTSQPKRVVCKLSEVRNPNGTLYVASYIEGNEYVQLNHPARRRQVLIVSGNSLLGSTVRIETDVSIAQVKAGNQLIANAQTFLFEETVRREALSQYFYKYNPVTYVKGSIDLDMNSEKIISKSLALV